MIEVQSFWSKLKKRLNLCFRLLRVLQEVCVFRFLTGNQRPLYSAQWGNNYISRYLFEDTKKIYESCAVRLITIKCIN